MDPVDLRGEGLDPAAGRLLVAAPTLADPHFARTVVLLLDVDDDGVLGVVLNRGGDVPVARVLEQWADLVDHPASLFRGGPVGTDSALALARLRSGSEEPPGWRRLFGDTGLLDLDSPRDVVGAALARVRIFAGYAGWSAEQLQDEIAEGAWYVVPGHHDDAFAADPGGVWGSVLRRQPQPLSWLATFPDDPSRN